MGNKLHKPVRHNVRKQGKKPRQYGTIQSTEGNSITTAHRLIHQIETLREKLESSTNDDQKNKLNREIELIQIQLNKLI